MNTLYAKLKYNTQVGNAKVVPRGLEPRTLRLLAVRSNQLSYETIEERGAAFITNAF